MMVNILLLRFHHTPRSGRGSILGRLLSLLLILKPSNSFLSRNMVVDRTNWRDHGPATDRLSALEETSLSSSSSSSSSTSLPRCTVGLIADIQYAPIPDGYSYSGVSRYYRHSLVAARAAAQHFQRERVAAVLNLGDLVDGKCQKLVENGGDALPDGIDPGHAAVDDVLDALSEYQHGPFLHVYGNHCLYNLNRQELQERLGIPFIKEPCGDLVGYYSHSLEALPGFRFVMLDCYDIAKLQRCEETSLKYQQAVRILAEKNHNYPENENSPEGLKNLDKRFVAFNGGIGSLQLEWLRRELQDVRDKNEKAIILSHQPILPGSTSPTCLIWNYDDVLDVLRDFSDVVVASFSGHAHQGGYLRDKQSGIHFRVVEAVLENPDPYKTYAMLDIYDDRLEVRGFGNCESAVYTMDHLTQFQPSKTMETIVTYR